MLQYCDCEDGAALAEGWLSDDTLASLRELNERCLELLAEQAAVRGSGGSQLLRQVADLWRILDTAARRRAAACPYLLLDAGFADAARWRAPHAPQVGDGEHEGYTAWFTVPAALEVARQVFTYAWYLARSQPAAARLLLGMPAPTALLLAQHTLGQIQALGACRAAWLRPRWPARVEAWRELLLAAAAGETQALERARLHGLTLLAGEARRAAGERHAP
jgi:hypothetical protein